MPWESNPPIDRCLLIRDRLVTKEITAQKVNPTPGSTATVALSRNVSPLVANSAIVPLPSLPVQSNQVTQANEPEEEIRPEVSNIVQCAISGTEQCPGVCLPTEIVEYLVQNKDLFLAENNFTNDEKGLKSYTEYINNQHMEN